MTPSKKICKWLLALVTAAPLLVPAAHGAGAGFAQGLGQAIGKELYEKYPPNRLFGRLPKATLVPSTLANIKSIAVIRPFEPRTYAATTLDAPVSAAGFRGAGDQHASSAVQEKFTTRVRQSLKAPISALLADSIAAQLTRMGYAARVEDGPWEVTDDYSTIDFDKIKSSADAVLVIKPTIVALLASDRDAPYVPTVTVIVTILNPAKEVLYRGFHASGWNPNGAGWRHSATEWKFDYYDEMASQPQQVADALARNQRQWPIPAHARGTFYPAG